MDARISGITQFFKERAADLRQIARGTRGEVEVGDVESEAWLVAADVGKKRGYPVDFADPADQQALLARLYNRLVKYAEKHIRYAVKLDTDWDKEESTSFGATLARLLTAPFTSDPQGKLQQLQDAQEVPAAVKRSYSEAAAYLLLLMRFEWDRDEVAEHLKISLGTLRLRLRQAGIKAKIQPSLFDGISQIGQDFKASIGRPKQTPRIPGLSGGQSEWAW